MTKETNGVHEAVPTDLFEEAEKAAKAALLTEMDQS